MAGTKSRGRTGLEKLGQKKERNAANENSPTGSEAQKRQRSSTRGSVRGRPNDRGR